MCVVMYGKYYSCLFVLSFGQDCRFEIVSETVVLRNFIKQKACVYIRKGPAHAADPFAPEIS